MSQKCGTDSLHSRIFVEEKFQRSPNVAYVVDENEKGKITWEKGQEDSPGDSRGPYYSLLVLNNRYLGRPQKYQLISQNPLRTLSQAASEKTRAGGLAGHDHVSLQQYYLQGEKTLEPAVLFL